MLMPVLKEVKSISPFIIIVPTPASAPDAEGVPEPESVSVPEITTLTGR